MRHRILASALPASLITARLVVAAAVFGGFGATVATAQEKIPGRPTLEAGVDSNDAQSYLDLALRVMNREPRTAVDAFYWASRINPGSAPAFYGRAVAGRMADDALLESLWAGPRDARERDALRKLDSLKLRAELLDPFLHRNLDRRAIQRFLDRVLHLGSDAVSSRALESALASAGPVVQGTFAFSESRFPAALAYYSVAIKVAKEKAPLYATRGEMFYLMGNGDSALANLKTALVEQQRIEDRKLVRFYQPKARYELQVGWIYEQQGKSDEARDAYGRALVEDLSFYPAHTRLALIALAKADTTTALAEFDLAVQTGQHDAVLMYQYGFLLAASRRLGEAAQYVLKSIDLEPYYAEPYAFLGRLYEASDMADLAAPQYATFLERAPQADAQRPFAAKRLQALRGMATKSPERQ